LYEIITEVPGTISMQEFETSLKGERKLKDGLSVRVTLKGRERSVEN